MAEATNTTNAQYLIISINGSVEFRSFLLGHNLSIGTVFSKNYSPKFAQLINITVRQKILSLRKEDFNKIECIQIS